MQYVTHNEKQSAKTNTTTTTTNSTTTTSTTTDSTITASESRESISTIISTGKLFNPERWNSTGRAYCKILPQLDKDNLPSLTANHSQGGIQNTIRDPTNALEDHSSPILHHTGANQEETNLGLQKAKLAHTGPTFQDGRSTCIKRTHRKRRLHNKIRSKRCLHSSANPPKSKTISGIPTSGSHLQLQGAKLRVKYS
ncbi:hypothetical protein BCV72DRAFT_317848, partial [Rhizopus microsporus var. microsporus]